jgi:hypothetical protein
MDIPLAQPGEAGGATGAPSALAHFSIVTSGFKDNGGNCTVVIGIGRYGLQVTFVIRPARLGKHDWGNKRVCETTGAKPGRICYLLASSPAMESNLSARKGC